VSTVILSAVFTGFARSKMPVALGAVIMKSKVTAEHSQGPRCGRTSYGVHAVHLRHRDVVPGGDGPWLI
jgi:hypothetical protein